MDLLSRLIAGSAAISSTKQKPNTPQERLQACKRLCTSFQQIWRNGTRLADDENASSHVANLLKRLNVILQDESRKAAPHSCLLYTVSTQIYIIITKLALSSDSPEIIGEATQFFHLLINGEADGLLDSKIFARALIDLVRRSTIFATIVVDEQGEADLVELLFEIATKIRLDPDILPGWFYPERDQGRSKISGSEARRSQFPLFYLLVDYVHHDGPTGDFARTGLLYLTETASRSRLLERWMIESDLAPQMASGLSALYSRLSRQAPRLSEREKSLPIIALSDSFIDSRNQTDTYPEAQQNIKSFLSYLAFWQDTLSHCKSIEVKDTLLDHFQVLFVQQLLYPSLLESSDVAGGSTSAVILHLYRILDTVDYQPLLRRMLQYLLASTKTETKQTQPRHSRARVSMSRQQSMEQLASLADQANTPSPDLFNLLDLLVISLHSKHAQTVNSSLKLVTIILRRHHQYVLHHLFASRLLPFVDICQYPNEFNEMLMQLFDLSGTIANTSDMDSSYEAALNDGRFLLDRHSCLLARAEQSQAADALSDHLAVTSNCRLFGALSDLLSSFFYNDTITNITLTETFVALAACEHISMKSWVRSEEAKQASPLASIFNILKRLTEHVQNWKAQIADWDALFVYQKTQLSVNGGSDLLSDTRSLSVQSRTSGKEKSPRLGPTEPPSTPPGSSTPRGRKMAPTPFISIDSTLASPSKLGISPVRVHAGSPLQQPVFPRDIAQPIPPGQSPIASASPTLTLLDQQLSLPVQNDFDSDVAVPDRAERLRLDDAGSGTSTPATIESISGVATPALQDAERSTASLSHVLTNAIILQEFILELAALLQIRGALFDEVDMA